MKYTSILAICLLFILFGCNKEENFTSNSNNKKVVSSKIIGAEEGIIKVKLSPEIGDNFISNKSNTLTKSGNSAIDAYMQKIGAKKMTRIFPYNAEFEERTREAGLHLWYKIEFDKSNPLTKVLYTLKDMEGIEIVEEVRKVIIPKSKAIIHNPLMTKSNNNFIMNDPGFKDQWHFKNNGDLSKNHVAGADINLIGAWEAGVYGNRNVIVAVVDGGIDYNHEDLKDNMWVNQKEKDGQPNVNDDGNKYTDDIYGYNFCKNTPNITSNDHGTHVAGIIAARNNNNIGICGIAGGNGDENSGVRLMSCQIFDGDEGSFDFETAEAIKYGADNGAVISQNSWGYEDEIFMSDIPSIKAAINYFIKNAGCDKNGEQREDSPMKGGIVIFAAGNEFLEIPYLVAYPAAYEKVISVSSMGPDFTVAPYSNRGSWVTIMAPGGDGAGRRISKTEVEYYNTNVYSTLPDDNYGYMPGTSMACPHVSGVAALILSKFGCKGYTPEMLKEQLLNAIKSENIDELNPEYKGMLGVGFLDAGVAVSENKKIAPKAVSNIEYEEDFDGILLKWKAVEDGDDITASKYKLYYSKNVLDEKNYKEGTLQEVAARNKKPGDEISIKLDKLEIGSTYYFALIAEDKWGLSSTPYCFTIKRENNLPPTIIVPENINIKITEAEIAVIDLIVNDPENKEWAYELSGSTTGVTASYINNGLRLTFKAQLAPLGKHKVTVTVIDSFKLKASVDIPFEVYKNNPPEQIKNFEKIFAVVSEDVTINLSEYFTDKEGNDIIYSAKSSREDIITANIENSNLILKPLKVGASEIEITAADIHKKQTVVKIQSQVVNNGIVYSAYPTKVKSDFNIKLNKKVNQAKIKIFTTTGNLVTETDFNGGNDNLVKLNLTNLAGGSYFLIVEANGETHKQAFIKL